MSKMYGPAIDMKSVIIDTAFDCRYCIYSSVCKYCEKMMADDGTLMRIELPDNIDESYIEVKCKYFKNKGVKYNA